MPKDPSGEGYDYAAFLDVLVNGGGKEQPGRNNPSSAASNGNAAKSTTASTTDDTRATRTGKENETRDIAGSTSNVSALAVAEAEEWESNGGMARRSRHYL